MQIHGKCGLFIKKGKKMEIERTEVLVRPAYENEWENAMGLAWKVFLKFEACDYTEQGVSSFQDFITDQTLKKVFLTGEYQLFVAVYRNEIIGLISLRNRTHISLLFVDEEFHRQGVGRMLMEYLWNYLSTEMGEHRVTVNSSPYATGFYHRLGFLDTDSELVADGIRYTPMVYVI